MLLPSHYVPWLKLEWRLWPPSTLTSIWRRASLVHHRMVSSFPLARRHTLSTHRPIGTESWILWTSTGAALSRNDGQCFPGPVCQASSALARIGTNRWIIPFLTYRWGRTCVDSVDGNHAPSPSRAARKHLQRKSYKFWRFFFVNLNESDIIDKHWWNDHLKNHRIVESFNWFLQRIYLLHSCIYRRIFFSTMLLCYKRMSRFCEGRETIEFTIEFLGGSCERSEEVAHSSVEHFAIFTVSSPRLVRFGWHGATSYRRLGNVDPLVQNREWIEQLKMSWKM